MGKRLRKHLIAILVVPGILATAPLVRADENLLPISPAPSTTAAENSGSVQWGPLLRQSLFFLGVEHSFRVAMDSDTQAGMGGKFFSGYWRSVSNLHGWADGDPFLVNYVGHPLQGAIAGDIWIHNDLRYRNAEFGRNRAYWTSRLRAMVFAWAYSEQFEIGPLSEASIGHIQEHSPQQGFVDHVITPTVGLGWMVAEDAIDRYLIRRIEARTPDRWVRILARGFLNPARSFANCMEFEHPWKRETGYMALDHAIYAKPQRHRTESLTNVPKFEFTVHATGMPLAGGRNTANCAGGGGSATFNLNRLVGLEADVSGCKMLGLESNVSGDSLTFAAGPRFTYRGFNRWTPWMHVLVGGQKLSEEVMYPDRKEAVLADPPAGMNPHQLHDLYTTGSSTTALAMQVGGGVDWTLNRTLAFRVGDVDYVHTLVRADQAPRPPDLRVTMGVVFRIGD